MGVSVIYFLLLMILVSSQNCSIQQCLVCDTSNSNFPPKCNRCFTGYEIDSNGRCILVNISTPILIYSLISAGCFTAVCVVICCVRACRSYRQSGDSPNNSHVAATQLPDDFIFPIQRDKKIIQEGKSAQCCVCLNGQIDCATICHHFFHFECAKKWIQIHFQCPVCRKIMSLREINKMPIINNNKKIESAKELNMITS